MGENVDVYEVGLASGLTREQITAAVGFLEQEELMKTAALEGRYSLTSRGIRAVDEPTTMGTSGDINISILNNTGRIEGSAVGGGDLSVAGSGSRSSTSWRMVLGKPLVAGVIASLIAAAIWAMVARDRGSGSISGDTQAPQSSVSVPATQITTNSSSPTTKPQFPGGASSQDTADAIAGHWSGTAYDAGVPFTITLNIALGCRVGQRCGSVYVSNNNCTGDWILWGRSGDRYEFKVDNFSATSNPQCEPGAGYYLAPQSGGLVFTTVYGPAGTVHRA